MNNQFVKEIKTSKILVTHDSIRKATLPDVKSQLKMLKKGMETNFQHFTTFKDIVNRNLDTTKNNTAYPKTFLLEEENKCLPKEIKKSTDYHKNATGKQ